MCVWVLLHYHVPSQIVTDAASNKLPSSAFNHVCLVMIINEIHNAEYFKCHDSDLHICEGTIDLEAYEIWNFGKTYAAVKTTMTHFYFNRTMPMPSYNSVAS